MARTSPSVLIALLLLALIAAPVSDQAQGQALRPLSQALLKRLAELDAAIDQATKSVQSAKVEDLKLSAQDRKFIEDSRARTIRSAELVRKQTDVLRRRQTLQDLFALKSVLDGFERQLDAFASRVQRAELRLEGDASAKASIWLTVIERSSDTVEAAALAFDGEALDVLTKADNAISVRGDGR